MYFFRVKLANVRAKNETADRLLSIQAFKVYVSFIKCENCERFLIFLQFDHERIANNDARQILRKQVACVASVSVGFGSKELQRENGASKRRGRGRGRKKGNLSPTSIFHFWLSPHFPRWQNTKNPVLCSQTPWKRRLVNRQHFRLRSFASLFFQIKIQRGERI